MNEHQKLAHEIIDLVESRLRELFPDIELKASSMEGNTLLHGENYYNLENEVTKAIMERSLKVHVVVGVFQGVASDIEAFSTPEKAQKHKEKLAPDYRNKGDIVTSCVEVDNPTQ